MVGASVSFEEGAGLLRDLAGIRVPTRQVERYAERLGEEAARFEREVSEVPPGPLAQTMYLGQDGTGVPMRKEELADRPGKQADGSSRTREMKLCAIWTADARDRGGRPTRDEGSITYTAAIERAETKTTDKLLAPFAAAGRAGGQAAWVRHRQPEGRHRRWSGVAVGHRGGVLPRHHRDPRQVPREGARPRRCQRAVSEVPGVVGVRSTPTRPTTTASIIEGGRPSRPVLDHGVAEYRSDLAGFGLPVSHPKAERREVRILDADPDAQ